MAETFNQAFARAKREKGEGVWEGLEGATGRTADSNLRGGTEGNGYFYVR